MRKGWEMPHLVLAGDSAAQAGLCYCKMLFWAALGLSAASEPSKPSLIAEEVWLSGFTMVTYLAGRIGNAGWLPWKQMLR